MTTIKADVLRSDIASSGFKQADLARILNVNPHTLSSRICQGTLDDSILESLSIILRQPKDKYIYMATKEEPQEGALPPRMPHTQNPCISSQTGSFR